MAVLRLVSPDQLDAQAAAEDAARVAAEDRAAANQNLNSSLAAFIDNKFGQFMRHRDGTNGWSPSETYKRTKGDAAELPAAWKTGTVFKHDGPLTAALG